MNTWYFTFEYPPEFGGGLSTYLRVVTDFYASRPESSLVVFTLSLTQSGLMSRRYLHNNVQLISINPNRSLEKEGLGYWVNNARLFERFADLFLMQIQTGQLDLPLPDYVEFPDGFGIGALTVQQKLCLNSRLADIPLLVTAHTPTYYIDRLNQMPTYKLPHYWHGQMELQSLAGADLVIGCSQAILDVVTKELGRTGAQMRRSQVLHNPFPLLDSPLPDMTAPRQHFYMASRLTHWKGVETAIKAFELLWQDGIEVPFLIYGDDTHFSVSGSSYAEYLQKRYGRYVDQGLIQIMGKQPRKVIAKAARHAYAQVHPSHFDNFPYSLLEAMAEGTLCIAGTNGGIGEIGQHGRDLLLCDVQDPRAFAQVLKTAMDLAPEERRAMAQSARAQLAEHCDVERYFEQKEALVAQLRASPASETDRTSFPFLSPAAADCVAPAQAVDPQGPELSVVIPYFNMGAFIDETLQSLRAATVDNLEIILVNDGSTDPASQQRLQSLHADHGLSETQMRIVTIPNGGVANARNIGVKLSTAPFVALLDSDDLIGARYYEKALKILRRYHNVSFCGAWIEDYNIEGRIRNWATWNAEPPLQLIMNQTNCQSLVYKRAAFEQHGWHDPDLRMFLDDWEGVIALLAGGHRGVMIPEPLFNYRIRPGSIFRSTGELWDINYEKITQKHAALYNRWGADLAAFMNANGPNNFYHIAGKESALRK